ncbi:GTPase IMAP family member 8-like [Trachinotus anak]|uniref:GTPase IMAP family member 8-like n=1 Tax=Trachinotus anak TaxID=443729 RepID=UPI0039F1C50A
MDDSGMRIVLLGKTGAGKSSLCNTIFGKKLFKKNHCANTETRKCQKATGSVNGKKITVINTPGLFDTNRSEEELKPEIVKCITECSPGPHAFLIVLKVEKYTGQEQEVITKICEYFSEEAFKYAVVVFNHGEQLSKGMKIGEFVRQNEKLRELVRKCGGRCHVFDNKYWKNNLFERYRKNKLQVKALLNTVKEMEKKGGYYTNEMLQAAERRIQQEEESIRKSSPYMSRNEIGEGAKRNFSEHHKKIVGVATDSDMRIVLLGKTGAGKSSLCNTIFGKKQFKKNHCANTETRKCQKETGSVKGKKITVIDTPGLFDTNRSEEELKPEIVKCITECSPGPHAFLILLKVEKYTDQEQEVINKICDSFSEEAFKYAVVVFTHGEQLPKGIKIEEFVRQNEKLRELVRKCGGRCHVFDNKYWKNNWFERYRKNKLQVKALLNTVKEMENKGGYYTNEMLQAAERRIQQEEESIRKSSQYMSRNEIGETAKRNVSKNHKKIVGVTTDSDLRIVLLGKTGAGKSSLCNTIFGEDVFKINHTANAEKSNCQTASVNGKKITVTDTPGFFDTDRSEEELKPEIVKCITECSPGPHAFLILLKVEKYTGQEQDVITKICEYFSEEALKYAVVVFTHGDQLPEGKKIEEFISQNEKLSELVRKCDGRCHIFDNKYWKNNQQDEYRNNQFQVTELLNTIKEMADKGGYYTIKMLQAVERKIQQEKRIRKSSPGMSQEEIRERAKRKVLKRPKKKVCVSISGGFIGYTEADRAGSVMEAAKNPAKPFYDKATNMINYKKQKQSEEELPLLEHSLLKRRPVLLRWLAALKRKGPPPGSGSRVCSEHFLEEDYIEEKTFELGRSETHTDNERRTKSLRKTISQAVVSLCTLILSDNMDDSDMRIVLLGKTGAGKSSLCNTIFGEDVFKINHCAITETRKCQKATGFVKGKKITVTDTPGLFDTNMSEEEVQPEIVKCITECSPGPHAFLIVLKVEEFTEEEQAVITKICEFFSEEALKYAVVVFTHGDQLPEGMKIEDFVKGNKRLENLMNKCGGRCHVFDNKYWKNNQQDEYRNNQFQVTELLNTIKVMVDKGHYYTNEMLQAVERKIQQEEERIRKSSPGMSQEEIREKAKRNVSDLLKTIVGVTTGVLLGTLLGLPVMIASVVKAIKKRAGGAVGVVLAVCTVAPAAGAVAGGYIGYTEADRAGSVKGAAKKAATAVFDTATNMIINKKQKQSEEK